jgi:hypothetical protein
MWLLFQLDGMLFGFLSLSSSSVFQSAVVPGGRNSISPPSPSPKTLLANIRVAQRGQTDKMSVCHLRDSQKRIWFALDPRRFGLGLRQKRLIIKSAAAISTAALLCFQ